MARLIVDLLTEPHPWWVWVIVAVIILVGLVVWIKKPWYE